jgi:chemotaxis protein methyltransferase CheR
LNAPPPPVPDEPWPYPFKRLRQGEFRRFQALVQAEAGIHLSEVKKPLLIHRLARRLRELGLDSFSAYYERLGDPGERQLMLECLCTHETHFFREMNHFDLLESRILPAWRDAAAAGARPCRVRAWAAGCSTGQEPYSLAMVLLAGLPLAQGWTVEVLATDLSNAVLERARDGIYPMGRAAEIPPHYLKRYMLRGRRGQAGNMAAGPELRAAVRFERLNLHGDPYPPGPFDMILCRNVLIYFDAAGRDAVLGRMVDLLAAGGLLLLGHAESLKGRGAGVAAVAHAAYVREGS